MTSFIQIDTPSIVPKLLEACPEFGPRWEGHLAFWEGEERGEYNDIAAFAHFMVDSFDAGEVKFFTRAFSCVEELLESGNAKVREYILIGLFEALQNISSHSFGSDKFLPFLGPLSREGWMEVERMWEGKSSLMDVLRAERTTSKVEEGEDF